MSSIDEARRRAGRQLLRDGETETELQITKHIIFAADRPVDWLIFPRCHASVVGISVAKDFFPSNGQSAVWHVNDGICWKVPGPQKCTRNCRRSRSSNVDAGQDDQHVP